MPYVLSGGTETISGAQFDGSTSVIEFDTSPPSAIAQTTLCLIYPTGTAANGNGVIWSRRNAGNTDGQTFALTKNGGSNIWVDFIGSCATTARPFALDDGTGGPITLNNWYHLAATWTGNPATTNIIHYRGTNGAQLVQRVVGTTTGGSSPANDSGSYSFRIGSFPGASQFNGTIAYVARWNRILALAELLQAQRLGPISVPQGLILCWANGRDYGPYAIKPTRQVAITPALTPPFGQRLLMRPFRKQWVTGTAGGGVGSASKSRWFLMG